MSGVNPIKVGVVTGLVLGIWHAVWVLLIWLGVAQVFYDWVLWMHMIHLQLTVGPFDPTAAMALILFTTIFGFVIGVVAGVIWNSVHRE